MAECLLKLSNFLLLGLELRSHGLHSRHQGLHLLLGLGNDPDQDVEVVLDFIDAIAVGLDSHGG